jgi:glutamate racemase
MKFDDLGESANEQLPIGIFDSGVGGLTVVRAMRRALPHEDIVYLGDTARVPYGTKSPSTVVRFSCEDTQFLLHHHVKAVIVGCSTVSAWALPILEQRFKVPVFGVILPGVRAALEQTRNGRIGVIGTQGTVRSMAYNRSIVSHRPGSRVFAHACPLLVPLVEEGWIHHPVTQMVLRDYLEPLMRHKIDTLIMACTHFPLLREAIRQVVGEDVALVDCADTCARFTHQRLEELHLLNTNRRRSGHLQAFVTDEPERFTKLAKHFLGSRIEPALQVVLPQM